MSDELINVLNLKYVNINKDLSFAKNDKDSLKIRIYLNDSFLSCPVCGSISIKKNGHRIKHVIHSISTQEPCHIVLRSKRFLCSDCWKSFIEFNLFSDALARISYSTKLSILEDLKVAYHLKVRYQEFNATATYETCDNELPDLINCFSNSPFKAFVEFGKLLNYFKEEIKNSFIVIDNRRLSNGPMEGVNSRLKCLIKNANGYKNFSRFRNRCIYTINKDVPISLYTNKTKK